MAQVLQEGWCTKNNLVRASLCCLLISSVAGKLIYLYVTSYTFIMTLTVVIDGSILYGFQEYQTALLICQMISRVKSIFKYLHVQRHSLPNEMPEQYRVIACICRVSGVSSPLANECCGYSLANLPVVGVRVKLLLHMYHPWLTERNSPEQVLLSSIPMSRDEGYCNICTYNQICLCCSVLIKVIDNI